MKTQATMMNKLLTAINNIKILIGLNRYNYDSVNEYKIVFNVINNYKLYINFQI